jgi:hypothetical protein
MTSLELPIEVLDTILSKTDGVPLYIEELTKMVLESGLLRDAGDRYLTSPRLERSEPGALECHLPKGVMVQRSHDKLNATGSARCKQTGPQPRRAPAAAQTTAQPTS